MPLINITLVEGKPQSYIKAVGDTLHQALRETWGIPEHDRFHIFHEKKLEHFYIDRVMWDLERTDDVLLFHFTTTPRTVEQKKAFFKRLPELLNENLGVRTEDVFISLLSNGGDDWTFGNGKMQLVQ